jgi:parvulin-like peptidyl-prolyl isomerase
MRRLAFAVGALLVFVCSAFAQQGQSSIQGKVVDASGASLPGATILITHEGSGVFRNVVSNSDGSYFATWSRAWAL